MEGTCIAPHIPIYMRKEAAKKEANTGKTAQCATLPVNAVSITEC